MTTLCYFCYTFEYVSPQNGNKPPTSPLIQAAIIPYETQYAEFFFTELSDHTISQIVLPLGKMTSQGRSNDVPEKRSDILRTSQNQ